MIADFRQIVEVRLSQFGFRLSIDRRLMQSRRSGHNALDCLLEKEPSRRDERCIITVTERSIMKHVIVTRRSCVYAEVGGGVVVTLGSRCREV